MLGDESSGAVGEHLDGWPYNISASHATSAHRLDVAHGGNRPGIGNGLRVIDANELFDETAAVINDGKMRDFLYEI